MGVLKDAKGEYIADKLKYCKVEVRKNVADC